MTAERDDTPSLQVMREAARQYIEARGLRAFGRAIGMSATGAGQMVRGKSQPRATTRRKLRMWYLEECCERGVNGGAAGVALIGIMVLVHNLPRPRQSPVALHVYGVVREEYRKRVPGWVSELKKLIETELPE